jgi:hypothetical protein
MFDVFSFLYSITIYSSLYIFQLYTTSLHTYVKLVIFFSKIFSRNNLYGKTTFVGSASSRIKNITFFGSFITNFYVLLKNDNPFRWPRSESIMWLVSVELQYTDVLLKIFQLYLGVVAVFREAIGAMSLLDVF